MTTSPAHQSGCAASRDYAFLLLAAAITLTACDGDVPAGDPFTRTDSAGVAIVESSQPVWGRGEGWTLGPEPAVVIGVREGDERYLLDDVRSVRRLSDGRIAVLDAGSRRVRVYDSTGVHLVDFGGDGDGPAEVRTPQHIGVVADTLFVYEAIGGDRKWFSPEGELLRSSGRFSQAERTVGTLHMLGSVEDSVGIGLRTGAAGYQPSQIGLNRESWSLWRFGLHGTATDSLLSVPGGEEMILESGPRGTLHQVYVFGKYTVLAISDRRIYVGSNDDFSIRVLKGDGTLESIIRKDHQPRQVRPSDVRDWIEERSDQEDIPPDERAEMRRRGAELNAAEFMPAFQSMVADSEDNLWVEEWEGVGLGQGRFSVFRSDGVWLGSVQIPEGLATMRISFDHQLMEIGPDYVLGVWSDEFGVEQVRLYRLEKD